MSISAAGVASVTRASSSSFGAQRQPPARFGELSVTLPPSSRATAVLAVGWLRTPRTQPKKKAAHDSSISSGPLSGSFSSAMSVSSTHRRPSILQRLRFPGSKPARLLSPAPRVVPNVRSQQLADEADLRPMRRVASAPQRPLMLARMRLYVRPGQAVAKEQRRHSRDAAAAAAALTPGRAPASARTEAAHLFDALNF
ncbi:hypothetical protein T492DRAFT_925525 [Pavlovales sp. CCMP2436]|nr:hypothetical protein T492DRAFT_925525 [Pavlovales sp. CCMP2436]